MIFRDPYTSWTQKGGDIGDIMAEPIWAMKLHGEGIEASRVQELKVRDDRPEAGSY